MNLKTRLTIFIIIVAIGFFAARQNRNSSASKDSSEAEAEFTQAYANAVAAALPTAKVRISDRLQVQIELDGGGSLTGNLDNAWSECKNHPESQAVVRAKYLKSTLESVGNLAKEHQPVKLESIVPLIRDSRCITALSQAKPIIEPLAADLSVVYAANMEYGFCYFGERDLPELKINRSDLRQHAIENLRRVLPEVKRQGEGPVYMLTAGGNFEASLLLLDTLWDDQAKLVEGDIVAAVPNRDVLLFTGSGSQAGITKLREAAERLEKTGDHPVSATLISRRQGKWVQFK